MNAQDLVALSESQAANYDELQLFNDLIGSMVRLERLQSSRQLHESLRKRADETAGQPMALGTNSLTSATSQHLRKLLARPKNILTSFVPQILSKQLVLRRPGNQIAARSPQNHPMSLSNQPNNQMYQQQIVFSKLQPTIMPINSFKHDGFHHHNNYHLAPHNPYLINVQPKQFVEPSRGQQGPAVVVNGNRNQQIVLLHDLRHLNSPEQQNSNEFEAERGLSQVDQLIKNEFETRMNLNEHIANSSANVTSGEPQNTIESPLAMDEHRVAAETTTIEPTPQSSDMIATTLTSAPIAIDWPPVQSPQAPNSADGDQTSLNEPDDGQTRPLAYPPSEETSRLIKLIQLRPQEQDNNPDSSWRPTEDPREFLGARNVRRGHRSAPQARQPNERRLNFMGPSPIQVNGLIDSKNNDDKSDQSEQARQRLVAAFVPSALETIAQLRLNQTQEQNNNLQLKQTVPTSGHKLAALGDRPDQHRFRWSEQGKPLRGDHQEPQTDQPGQRRPDDNNQRQEQSTRLSSVQVEANGDESDDSLDRQPDNNQNGHLLFHPGDDVNLLSSRHHLERQQQQQQQDNLEPPRTTFQQVEFNQQQNNQPVDQDPSVVAHLQQHHHNRQREIAASDVESLSETLKRLRDTKSRIRQLQAELNATGQVNVVDMRQIQQQLQQHPLPTLLAASETGNKNTDTAHLTDDHQHVASETISEHQAAKTVGPSATRKGSLDWFRSWSPPLLFGGVSSAATAAVAANDNSTGHLFVPSSLIKAHNSMNMPLGMYHNGPLTAPARLVASALGRAAHNVASMPASNRTGGRSWSAPSGSVARPPTSAPILLTSTITVEAELLDMTTTVAPNIMDHDSSIRPPAEMVRIPFEPSQIIKAIQQAKNSTRGTGQHPAGDDNDNNWTTTREENRRQETTVRPVLMTQQVPTTITSSRSESVSGDSHRNYRQRQHNYEPKQQPSDQQQQQQQRPPQRQQVATESPIVIVEPTQATVTPSVVGPPSIVAGRKQNGASNLHLSDSNHQKSAGRNPTVPKTIKSVSAPKGTTMMANETTRISERSSDVSTNNGQANQQAVSGSGFISSTINKLLEFVGSLAGGQHQQQQQAMSGGRLNETSWPGNLNVSTNKQHQQANKLTTEKVLHTFIVSACSLALVCLLVVFTTMRCHHSARVSRRRRLGAHLIDSNATNGGALIGGSQMLANNLRGSPPRTSQVGCPAALDWRRVSSSSSSSTGNFLSHLKAPEQQQDKLILDGTMQNISLLPRHSNNLLANQDITCCHCNHCSQRPADAWPYDQNELYHLPVARANRLPFGAASSVNNMLSQASQENLRREESSQRMAPSKLPSIRVPVGGTRLRMMSAIKEGTTGAAGDTTMDQTMDEHSDGQESVRCTCEHHHDEHSADESCGQADEHQEDTNTNNNDTVTLDYNCQCCQESQQRQSEPRGSILLANNLSQRQHKGCHQLGGQCDNPGARDDLGADLIDNLTPRKDSTSAKLSGKALASTLAANCGCNSNSGSDVIAEGHSGRCAKQQVAVVLSKRCGSSRRLGSLGCSKANGKVASHEANSNLNQHDDDDVDDNDDDDDDDQRTNRELCQVNREDGERKCSVLVRTRNHMHELAASSDLLDCCENFASSQPTTNCPHQRQKQRRPASPTLVNVSEGQVKQQKQQQRQDDRHNGQQVARLSGNIKSGNMKSSGVPKFAALSLAASTIQQKLKRKIIGSSNQAAGQQTAAKLKLGLNKAGRPA